MAVRVKHGTTNKWPRIVDIHVPCDSVAHMIEPLKKKRQWTWVYIIAILLSFGSSAVTGVALLGERHTGAREAVWHNPDGTTAKERMRGCANPTMESIVHDGAVWMACADNDSSGSQAGLARFDPGAGEVTVLPMPEQYSQGSRRTRGAAAGPDGELCYAYSYADSPDLIAIGVAKGTEWSVPVQGLSSSLLLGMDWRGQACEAVTAQPEQPPQLNLMSKDGVQTQPFTDNWNEFCGPEKTYRGCRPVFAFRSPENRWVLVFSHYGPLLEEGGTHASVEPGQTPRPFDVGRFENTLALHYDAEVHELGQMRAPNEPVIQVKADGTLAPIASRPNAVRVILRMHYDFTETRVLQQRYTWLREVDGIEVVQRPVRGRLLRIKSDGGFDENPLLTVSDVTDPNDVRSGVVGRFPSFACGTELASGTFLTRPDGGYWLVGNSGCYVTMDENFQRTDPLSLLQHLRSDGSRYSLDSDVREHEYWLAWTLLGWLPCFLLSWVIRRRRRFLLAIGPGALLFAGTGLWGMMRLLPLLQ